MVQARVTAGERMPLADIHTALATTDLIGRLHPSGSRREKTAAAGFAVLLSVVGRRDRCLAARSAPSGS